jgi:hypothetical protein
MIEIIFNYDFILYEFVPWKLNGPVSIWNISPLKISKLILLINDLNLSYQRLNGGSQFFKYQEIL